MMGFPIAFLYRNLVVGSTVMYMGYVDVPALTTSFTTLRRRRFIQGTDRYDNELKARFRNEPVTDPTTPERRYQAVGYARNAAGAALADFEKLLKIRLMCWPPIRACGSWSGTRCPSTGRPQGVGAL